MRPQQTLDRRRYVQLLAATGGLSTLTAGCVGDDDDDDDDGVADDIGDDDDDDSPGEVSMDLVVPWEDGHILVEAAHKFVDNVEAETDDIDINLTFGGAYGAPEEVSGLVNEGVIDMHISGVWPVDAWATEYYFINVPYVLHDFDHLIRILNSDEIQPMNDKLIEVGNQAMIGNPVYRGYRNTTANVEIRHPDDFQGVSFRSPGVEPYVALYEAYGASVETTGLDELYSALQQGLVDGAEGDVEQIVAYSLEEVQDYLILTQHHPIGGFTYINWDFYEGLDETHQEVIDDAIDEATSEANEIALDREEDLIEDLGQEMEIIDDVDHDAFVEASRPVLDEFFETTYEEDLEYWQDI